MVDVNQDSVTINPLWTSIATMVVRTVIQAVGAVGAVQAQDEATKIVSALSFLAATGWSAYAWYKTHAKQKAIAAGAPVVTK